MVREKVLRNPIKPKVRITSKGFVAPSKAQATTGKFMDAGDNYGSGFRVNVGKEKATSIKDGPIPFGCEKFNASDAIT
jgi:hypothetical protein